MTPVSHSTVPEQVSPGSGRPWCDACGTDSYLFIESVGASRTAPGQSLEISYTCVECDGYYAHDVGTQNLSPVILRQFPPQALEALDGLYLHCGEPMTTGLSVERSIVSTLSPGPEGESELEAYLRTKVLHCRCGFQMELPPTAGGPTWSYPFKHGHRKGALGARGKRGRAVLVPASV